MSGTDLEGASATGGDENAGYLYLSIFRAIYETGLKALSVVVKMEMRNIRFFLISGLFSQQT